jgi:hypothetical protein
LGKTNLFSGGIALKKKTETCISPTKKEGVVSPFPQGSPFNPEPRNGKQGIYRSVAVKVPGTSSPMIVHVKEY